MKCKSVFVHTLNLATAIWILSKRDKPDKIYYISSKINPKLLHFLGLKVSTEQISLCWGSRLYLQYDKNLYDFVENQFKSSGFINIVQGMLDMLNLETEKLITSLKKYFVHIFSNDFKIITLAKDLSNNANISYVIVNEYGFLKNLSNNKLKIKRSISLSYFIKGYVKVIYSSLRCLRKILCFKKEEVNNFGKINIIFEQMYASQEDNPEFGCFYRYFRQRDDILYICVDADSSIYKTLKSDKKPVLLREEIYFLNKTVDSLKVFTKLFSLLIISLSLKSIAVRRAVIDIFYEKLYYEAIFRRFRPSYYLKIRFDFGLSHPVATAVADKYSVKHVGYQHGPYCWFRADVAHIDFHYYGLIGWHFRDVLYSKSFPKNINYSVIGAITGERLDSEYVNDKLKSLKIGIFTNWFKGNLEWKPLFEKYVEIICEVLRELDIPDIHLIFKEKGYSKWSESVIVRLCEQHGLSYEIVYHNNPLNIKYGYSKEIIDMVKSSRLGIHQNLFKWEVDCLSEEVIETVDIVISVSPCYSTIDWEALGKNKKCIVFGNNSFRHPFEEYCQALVVRSKNEFSDSIRTLLEQSHEEYIESIRPVVENCGKKSNGNLVKEFFESIENQYKIKNNEDIISSL